MVLALSGLLAGSATAAEPARQPAAKPATARPAPFDARAPASLLDLFAANGANARLSTSSPGGARLEVTTPAYGFGVDYVGCDSTGRGCQALAFSTASERRVTLAQINVFNQTSLNCRVFQDAAGKTHIAYSTLLSRSDTRQEMEMHVAAWRGCLTEFGEFLRDPVGYLAAAP